MQKGPLNHVLFSNMLRVDIFSFWIKVKPNKKWRRENCFLYSVKEHTQFHLFFSLSLYFYLSTPHTYTQINQTFSQFPNGFKRLNWWILTKSIFEKINKPVETVWGRWISCNLLLQIQVLPGIVMPVGNFQLVKKIMQVSNKRSTSKVYNTFNKSNK